MDKDGFKGTLDGQLLSPDFGGGAGGEANFKDTPLGPLPQEWKIVGIGDLVEKGVAWIKNGYAQGEHNLENRGVPHLRPFNVTTCGQIDLSQIKYVVPPPESSTYWVKPNDIIFNNTNSEELVGKTAFFHLDGDYVISNHMTIIRIAENGPVDAYWLSQLIHNYWQKGIFRALCRRHVNQASVSLDRMKGVQIPLPPLSEQRAIAHVLSTVRQSIEATERVIAAARQLKRSLMEHLFTYGPVPVDQAEHVLLKETEIGEVPKEWTEGRFDEFSILQRGYDITKEQQRSGTVPVVSSSGIKSYHDTALVKGPGVVIGRKGTLGKTHFIPSDYWPHDTTLWIKDFMGNHPKFIYYLLSRLKLEKLDTGTSNPTLNRNYVHPLKIACPNKQIQEQIAGMLDILDPKITIEKQRKTSLEALFNSLLHHLMTGKVRVV